MFTGVMVIKCTHIKLTYITYNPFRTYVLN